MKKVYIHIGLHKTATTTMQKFFFPNLEILNPELSYNNQLIYPYLESCWKFDSYEHDKEFHLVKSKIARIKEEILVISMEAFCGDLFTGYKNENYGIKLDHLKKLFDACDLNLIFVLRQPSEWLISCYKEAVKEHHFQSFQEFISSFNSNTEAKIQIKSLDIYALSVEKDINIEIYDFNEIV